MNDADKILDLLGRLESKIKSAATAVETSVSGLSKRLETLRQQLQEIETARTQGVVPVGLVSQLIQLDKVRGVTPRGRSPHKAPKHRKGERLAAGVRFFLNRDNAPAPLRSLVRGMPGFTYGSVVNLLTTHKEVFEKVVTKPGSRKGIGWKLRDGYYQSLIKGRPAEAVAVTTADPNRPPAPEGNSQADNPESVEGVG